MKTMTVNLQTSTVTAHSKDALLKKLRNTIKYGYNSFTSCDVGDINTKHDKDYVYGITLHKKRLKRARKDHIKANKLMDGRTLNSIYKMHGYDKSQNPMITIKQTQWVATVTKIPKVVLRANNQKIVQNKDHWKLV